MRLVKQLAEAIARALKLASAAKVEDAPGILRAACGEALGMEYEVLAMLDARSAVELLGSRERVEAFIQLVEAIGDQKRAQALQEQLQKRAPSPRGGEGRGEG